MSASLLSLNQSKTEFLLIGLLQQLSKVSDPTLSMPSNVSSSIHSRHSLLAPFHSRFSGSLNLALFSIHINIIITVSLTSSHFICFTAYYCSIVSENKPPSSFHSCLVGFYRHSKSPHSSSLLFSHLISSYVIIFCHSHFILWGNRYRYCFVFERHTTHERREYSWRDAHVLYQCRWHVVVAEYKSLSSAYWVAIEHCYNILSVANELDCSKNASLWYAAGKRTAGWLKTVYIDWQSPVC